MSGFPLGSLKGVWGQDPTHNPKWSRSRGSAPEDFLPESIQHKKLDVPGYRKMPAAWLEGARCFSGTRTGTGIDPGTQGTPWRNP